jgi:hypothetical protein
LSAVDDLTATQLVRATELHDGDLSAQAIAGQDADFCHS